MPVSASQGSIPVAGGIFLVNGLCFHQICPFRHPLNQFSHQISLFYCLHRHVSVVPGYFPALLVNFTASECIFPSFELIFLSNQSILFIAEILYHNESIRNSVFCDKIKFMFRENFILSFLIGNLSIL